MIVLFVGGPLDGERMDFQEPLPFEQRVPVFGKTPADFWGSVYDPTGLFVGEILCRHYVYTIRKIADRPKDNSSNPDIYWIYCGEDTKVIEQLLAHYRPDPEQDVLEGGQAGRVGQDRRADGSYPGVYNWFGSPLPESCRAQVKPSSPDREPEKMRGMQPPLSVLQKRDEGEEPDPVWVVKEGD